MKVKNIGKTVITLTPIKDGGIVNIQLGAGAVSENPLLTEKVIAPFLKRGLVEVLDGTVTKTEKKDTPPALTIMERFPLELTAEALDKEYNAKEIKELAGILEVDISASKNKAESIALIIEAKGV